MDKLYFKGIVQSIMNSQFSSSNRRRIVEYHDRINFCCPYCGDGKSETKKRGNIWWNKLIYICFNCGKKTNLDRFSKDFNQQIEPEKKLELINHLNESISYKDAEDDIISTQFDKFLNIKDLERIFNNNEYVITDFKPINPKGKVYQYLINRGIDKSLHKNIWEGKYWYNSDRYDPIICLLNRNNDKVIGMQIRNLKEGKRRLFKIYNFETLYKWIHNVDDIIDIDLNQVVIYNKLSYYFNILNINLNDTITVFEGYLDSLFYPNSIGVVGVETDMRFLESNDLDIQYFYDNDPIGYVKSELKLKQNYRVFLWKKLFQDIVNKKNSNDPYKLLYRVSKVKDLNKLAELSQNPYKSLNLKDYFSKDIMDIKWIPKKEKRKYKKIN